MFHGRTPAMMASSALAAENVPGDVDLLQANFAQPPVVFVLGAVGMTSLAQTLPQPLQRILAGIGCGAEHTQCLGTALRQPLVNGRRRRGPSFLSRPCASWPKPWSALRGRGAVRRGTHRNILARQRLHARERGSGKSGKSGRGTPAE